MGGRGRRPTRIDPAHVPDSRARRALAGVAVAVAAIATTAAGAARPSTPRASVLRTIHVGGIPDRVVVGAGAVWVGDGGQVLRVDPITERFDHIPGAATPIAVGPGALWVRAHDRAHALLRIDPMTTKPVATVDLGVDPGAIAVSGPDVWVADPAGTVVRVDAVSNTVRASIWVGSLTFGIAATTRAVWVSGRSFDDRQALIWRIDPATNTVVTTIATAVNCQTLADDAAVTWADCITAHLIDPDRDALVSTRAGTANGLVVADGAAWALDFDRTLRRINNGDRSVRTVSAPAGSEGIGVGYGAVWVANPAVAGTVTRDGRGSLTRIPTSRFGATGSCSRCDQTAGRRSPAREDRRRPRRWHGSAAA